MTTDVAQAQTLLDAASASWPDELRAAWKMYRAYARRHERISQTTLPAVGTAAQEMVLARDHAHRAIEAMSGVFGQQHDDDPEDTEE